MREQRETSREDVGPEIQTSGDIRFGSRRQNRSLQMAWLVLAFVLLGIIFVVNPAEARLYPRCLLHSVTGFYCSGCGALRALHLLLHGRFVDAVRMNALLVIGLPVGGVLWVVRPGWRSKLLPWVAVVALVVFTILRNIPSWPFVLLAPR